MGYCMVDSPTLRPAMERGAEHDNSWLSRGLSNNQTTSTFMQSHACAVCAVGVVPRPYTFTKINILCGHAHTFPPCRLSQEDQKQPAWCYGESR